MTVAVQVQLAIVILVVEAAADADISNETAAVAKGLSGAMTLVAIDPTDATTRENALTLALALYLEAQLDVENSVVLAPQSIVETDVGLAV